MRCNPHLDTGAHTAYSYLHAAVLLCRQECECFRRTKKYHQHLHDLLNARGLAWPIVLISLALTSDLIHAWTTCYCLTSGSFQFYAAHGGGTLHTTLSIWFPEDAMHKHSPHDEAFLPVQKLHTDIAALFCREARCCCLCFQVFCAEEVAQGAIPSLIQVLRDLLFRPQPAQQSPPVFVRSCKEQLPLDL